MVVFLLTPIEKYYLSNLIIFIGGISSERLLRCAGDFAMGPGLFVLHAVLVILYSVSSADFSGRWQNEVFEDGKRTEDNLSTSALLAPQPPFPSSLASMAGLVLSFIAEESEDVKVHFHSVMENLPEDWHILLLTKGTHRTYVEGMVEQVREQMHQDMLETGGWIGRTFNRPVYISAALSDNDREKHCLLLNKAFYEALPTEHLLTMDTNSVMATRQGLPDVPGKSPVRQLNEFLDYPFIGVD